jgi:glycogen synthase
MTNKPNVSIIINTDGRVESLKRTLDSLQYLKYPHFEVVVVTGPTRDGAHEYLQSCGHVIKIGDCPDRNLSKSRNIGIGLSSGEILAFLDDDAIPEPEWLDDVTAPFVDPKVGISGGFLHNHTGKAYQWRFGTVNRLANANEDWDRAAPEYNFPGSYNVPHVMGANSVFRRDALLDVGGFNEEFEYYLDETDVICRILDSGWHVVQIDTGFVHHKFLQSHIRNSQRIVTNWYPIIKNKAYFCFLHGKGYHGTEEILDEITRFIDRFRKDIRWAVENDLLAYEIAEKFEDEAARAFQDGIARSTQPPRIPRPNSLRCDASDFCSFERLPCASQQRCFVFTCQNYPPEPLGGIGRYVHVLARKIAQLGHQVHVLTRGAEHDRVDFEDGVWVHRIVIRVFSQQSTDSDEIIPAHIWNYSMTMLEEAREIASRRKVDCVHAPIWDAEGIAFLRYKSFPLITSLHTTLKNYLDSNPSRYGDESFMRDFARPMLSAERELLLHSDGLLANSKAIVSEIEASHNVSLKEKRVAVVPRGLEDWTGLPANAPDPLAEGMLRLVFTGRLESRKGIDILLEIAPDLLTRHPEAHLDVVGNDKIPTAAGTTWREQFESNYKDHPVASRIRFHGEVSDTDLRGFYHAADVILAPSRFESFGLVHLESSMFGRPVVGCRIGGMPEVIIDGHTGLLAEPADAASLLECIERLLTDVDLRARLGKQARLDYLRRFSPDRMTDSEISFLCEIADIANFKFISPSPKATSPKADGTQKRSAQPSARPRIALIGGVAARHDGISEDIVNTWRYLIADERWDVSVLTTRNDFPDMPATVVRGLADLLLNPDFLSADALLYHFGIWNPLFDALPIGNGKARQAVFFHNITPPEFVPPKGGETVKRSFIQLNNLRSADRLWPVSQINYELLKERNFNSDLIDIIPVAVADPPIARLLDRPAAPIEILCLGRIAPVKGIRDLIEAIALIRNLELPRFRLRIAGNLEYSDAAYCDAVQNDIIKYRLEDIIEFIGTVKRGRRNMLLHSAHIVAIPSYHEGFSKSAIEGLRAGGLPVGYAAHNLRYIADGLCRMTTVGDRETLARALAESIKGISVALADPAATFHVDRGDFTATEFATAAFEHVSQFSPDRVGALIRHHVERLLCDNAQPLESVVTPIMA